MITCPSCKKSGIPLSPKFCPCCGFKLPELTTLDEKISEVEAEQLVKKTLGINIEINLEGRLMRCSKEDHVQRAEMAKKIMSLSALLSQMVEIKFCMDCGEKLPKV